VFKPAMRDAALAHTTITKELHKLTCAIHKLCQSVDRVYCFCMLHGAYDICLGYVHVICAHDMTCLTAPLCGLLLPELARSSLQFKLSSLSLSRTSTSVEARVTPRALRLGF
jgi:hypothetical protein